MAISDATIIHHVGIVLVLLFVLSKFGCCHPIAYFGSLVYIYLVSNLVSVSVDYTQLYLFVYDVYCALDKL